MMGERRRSLGMVGLALAIALVAAACGGGGGGGGAADPGPANTFTGVTMAATASAPLTINAMPASAGAVAFTLTSPGASAGLSLRRDPGAAKPADEHGFVLQADDGSGAVEKYVLVTINTAPEEVLDLGSVAVRQVRLFHSRLGMGASLSDLARFRNVPYATMISTLLAEKRSTPVQSPPSWVDSTIPTWQEIGSWSTAKQDAYTSTKGSRINDLRVWWFREMLTTSSPLTERMVLFWHNHFVTSMSDIFQPETSWRYLKTLRTHAMGNFRDFLDAICIDPAMVAFLDNASNEVGKPNENFARELMELFTLGEGQVYTEDDVVQVARAFTGYGLTDRQAFVFKGDAAHGNKHDFGTNMTILGSGPAHFYGARFPGIPAGQTTVIDLILAKTRAAVHIAEKLWDEFIGGPRDAPTITAVANAFRADYEITDALSALFTSAAFIDVSREGYLVRSPIELYIGMYRSLEVLPEVLPGNDQWQSLIWMGNDSDQLLGDPPNVRGWPGGTTWITTKNVMDRRSKLDGWKIYELQNRVPDYLRPVLATLLLPIPPVVEVVHPGNPMNAWQTTSAQMSPLRACFRDPAINLK
jgi:uncharacterized protein (DUF1800 family)